MPRYARLHVPGAAVHVIARFVNREHRLAGAAERALVLARLPLALARADWALHAVALMSSHLHLVMTAGNAPPAAFLKPLCVGVAQALNAMHARTGPVFSERASTTVVPPARFARLVAYVHNNPVRAGVVADARESDWTSHRAWIGAETAPRWLSVASGLASAGFDTSRAGRDAFAAYVRDCADAKRDPAWSAATMRHMRAATRARTALPVELSSAAADDGCCAASALHVGRPSVEARWEGDLADLVSAAARSCGCPAEVVRSRTKQRAAVTARRTVMVAGAWLMRRQVNELAAALAITNSSASRLLRRGHEVLERAHRLDRELRARDARARGAGAVDNG